MSNYRKKYNKGLERAVLHIFNNFLLDTSIKEVTEAQAVQKNHLVWIEMSGTFEGEMQITLSDDLVSALVSFFHKNEKVKKTKSVIHDVTGEIANLISGTFVNQLQYIGHDIKVSPPEFEEDPISMKALYDNICLSFSSTLGGFDIEIFYKDLIFS